MTARYMVTYDIPSERPNTGCVLHDDKKQFRIVTGSPNGEEAYNHAAAQNVPLVHSFQPEAPLEEALAAYLGKSGYVELSGWEDSPYSYEDTIERLRGELVTLLEGAALERNARLMNVVRAGTETGVDVEPDNQSMTILLDTSGERERMAQPGLGYPVPDEARKRQIIQELLDMPDEDEATVVIVPTAEEGVFSEREDLPGSEEGS